jgi:hypothetical protein
VIELFGHFVPPAAYAPLLLAYVDGSADVPASLRAKALEVLPPLPASQPVSCSHGSHISLPMCAAAQVWSLLLSAAPRGLVCAHATTATLESALLSPEWRLLPPSQEDVLLGWAGCAVSLLRATAATDSSAPRAVGADGWRRWALLRSVATVCGVEAGRAGGAVYRTALPLKLAVLRASPQAAALREAAAALLAAEGPCDGELLSLGTAWAADASVAESESAVRLSVLLDSVLTAPAEAVARAFAPPAAVEPLLAAAARAVQLLAIVLELARALAGTSVGECWLHGLHACVHACVRACVRADRRPVTRAELATAAFALGARGVPQTAAAVVERALMCLLASIDAGAVAGHPSDAILAALPALQEVAAVLERGKLESFVLERAAEVFGALVVPLGQVRGARRTRPT